jgi:hypothetical protein
VRSGDALVVRGGWDYAAGRARHLPGMTLRPGGCIRGRRSRPEPGAVRAPAGSQGAGGPDTPAYAALARVADPAVLPPAYTKLPFDYRS